MSGRDGDGESSQRVETDANASGLDATVDSQCGLDATAAPQRNRRAAGPSDPTLPDDGSAPTLMAPDSASGAAPDTVPTGRPEKLRLALERGALLDRYVILDQIGAGGMGVVYLAYDPDLERRVAIKLLHMRRGHDPANARARLMREGQAIAQLSHPNVVQVFELGTRGDELFIVMEFVAGQSLGRWRKEHERSLDEILEIFSQAGAGLAAAHDKGIIHRDFKPENMLVGDDGRVRVLDFGLARALEGPATPPTESSPSISTSSGSLHSSLTQAGAVMGTPSYMPPEQHQAAETGPASDQFSFCVALWEAVYGERPFPGETMSELVWSVNTGKMREPPEDVKAPGWLAGLLKRGLSVDPDDRFPSMNALLAELGRDRGATRRRLLLGGAFVAVASVAVFSIATRGGGASPCRDSERKLVEVWDAETRAGVRAAFTGVEARYGAEVLSIVERDLDAFATEWTDMHRGTCEATRVHGEQSEEVLDARMACLERRRRELSSLVELFAGADAELVQRAPRAVRGLTPIDTCADAPIRLPDDPAARTRVTELQSELARVKALFIAGKNKDGLELATSVAEQAAEIDYEPVRAEAMLSLGVGFGAREDNPNAEKWLADAYFAAIASRHTSAATESAIELLLAISKQGRHEEAEKWVRHARASLSALGSNQARTADLESNLGLLYEDMSKYEKALEHHAVALDIRRRLFGDQHFHVGVSLNNSGLVYYSLGKYEEALSRFVEAHGIFAKALGAHHPHVGLTARNIGNIHFELGKLDEAEPYFRIAVEIASEVHGKRSANAAMARFSMATIFTERGDFDDATAELEDVLAVFEAERGKDSMEVAMVANSLGIIAGQQKRHEDALAYYRRSGDIRIAKYGPEHPQAARAHSALGAALADLGRYADALEQHREAEKIYRKALGDEHEQVAGALLGVGEAQLRLGQPARAIAPLEEAVAILAKTEGNRVWWALAGFTLANALWDSNRDRKRALSLARESRGILAAAEDQDSHNKAADVEAWLKAR